MDRLEIVACGATGEAVFLPRRQKSFLGAQKKASPGIGNFNCRWGEIILDVNQRHTRMQSSMQYLIPVVDKAHEREMAQRRAKYL